MPHGHALDMLGFIQVVLIRITYLVEKALNQHFDHEVQ